MAEMMMILINLLVALNECVATNNLIGNYLNIYLKLAPIYESARLIR